MASNHSPRFEHEKRYYDRGLWSRERVAKAVECGWITAAEYAEIVGTALSEGGVGTWPSSRFS